MSDKVGSNMTSDDEDANAKSLMTFTMQLAHHSQWKIVRNFGSGSYFEIIYSNAIFEVNEGRVGTLDIDRMTYDRDYYAFPRCILVPETYTGEIIRIYTDDVHIGYVRLIKERDNTEVSLFDIAEIKDKHLRHGPAVQQDAIYHNLNESYSLSNAKHDKAIFDKLKLTLIDNVWAVHCPYWPIAATEWITRRRFYGIPSKSVVKQVVHYGCDFVQVSHNKHCNDGEWRYSFSKPEFIIIRSLAPTHRIIYFTLWVLNKKAATKNLCSYYFKTLLLWACEEKLTQFWRDDSFVHSVRELLIHMMQCLKSKSCLNYFIPGNNMMDHLIDTDLSLEINALWRTFQIPKLITQKINLYRQFELPKAPNVYCFELPAWIKRAEVICQRLANDIDSYTDLLNRNLTTDLQSALYVELSNIYRGLDLQQKFINFANAPEMDNAILEAECNLLMAANLCESNNRDVIDYCNTYFINTIITIFKPCKQNVPSPTSNGAAQLSAKRGAIIAKREIILNDHKEQKTLLYSQSTTKKYDNKFADNYFRDTISEGRNVNISLSVRKMNRPQNEYNSIGFIKEWPGRSPTVNVSWFIAKAYLTNLYYTTQRDVSLTIQTCDDIIKVYEQSKRNFLYAEHIFPVVLSTQWTNIYDIEIQELLGFYSLCSYVLDASSRSVYLGVSPVLFALYLKLRTVKGPWVYLRRWNGLLSDWIKQYIEHSESCAYNSSVNKGRFVLYRSLMNSQKALLANECSKISSTYFE